MDRERVRDLPCAPERSSSRRSGRSARGSASLSAIRAPRSPQWTSAPRTRPPTPRCERSTRPARSCSRRGSARSMTR